jgi:hypothetical protein
LSDSPLPVRNDLPRPGREILVLRHHELRKGAHQEFYRISRDDYWPYFERLGARVVGQWKSRSPASADSDDVYRLVRYASFEHWEATRADRADALIAGNGPAWTRAQQALADRGGLQSGSKGAYFLQASASPDVPLFMPALAERYELDDSAPSPSGLRSELAVRLDIARPREEIVELRYQRIKKGCFARLADTTRSSLWPWEAKLGARPIGQWLVIYPPAPSRTAESLDYDEIITMTRYAGEDHRAAMAAERAVELGGNGPDWRAWNAALRDVDGLTIQTSVELMHGYLHDSPPTYLPALPEQYRRQL